MMKDPGRTMPDEIHGQQVTGMTNQEENAWIRWFITNWVIADPNYIIQDKHKSYKNYQKHQGTKYIYLFGGRLRTVKQAPLNIAIGVVLVAAGVLFWVFEAKWVWYHISPAVPIIFSYVWIVLSSMFIKASTSDPGVLPRNIHTPVDPRSIDLNQRNTDLPDEYYNTITLPYYQQLHHGVSVKYCPTCHIWRPPRASHCGTCNVCIVNHDHHCIYLNNCIGLRNYQYFLWLLLTSVTSLSMVIVLSFIQIFYYRISNNNEGILTFKQSIDKYPASFFLAILCCLLIVYPFLLLGLHVYLTAQNITTREYLNNVRPDKSYVNVFSSNILTNLYINWIGKARGGAYYRVTDTSDPNDIRSHTMAKVE